MTLILWNFSHNSKELFYRKYPSWLLFHNRKYHRHKSFRMSVWECVGCCPFFSWQHCENFSFPYGKIFLIKYILTPHLIQEILFVLMSSDPRQLMDPYRRNLNFLRMTRVKIIYKVNLKFFGRQKKIFENI